MVPWLCNSKSYFHRYYSELTLGNRFGYICFWFWSSQWMSLLWIFFLGAQQEFQRWPECVMAKSLELCLSRNGTVCVRNLGLPVCYLEETYFLRMVVKYNLKKLEVEQWSRNRSPIALFRTIFPIYCLASLLNEWSRKKKFWLRVCGNFNHKNFICCDLKKTTPFAGGDLVGGEWHLHIFLKGWRDRDQCL